MLREAMRSDVWRPDGADLGAGGRGFDPAIPTPIFRMRCQFSEAGANRCLVAPHVAWRGSLTVNVGSHSQ
jgi:hypothetical protein